MSDKVESEAQQFEPGLKLRLRRLARLAICRLGRHKYRRVEGVETEPFGHTHWHCERCWDYRVGPYISGECRVTESIHVDDLGNGGPVNG